MQLIIGKMRTRSVVLNCLVASSIGWATTAAPQTISPPLQIAPPAASADYNASWKAIDELKPFLGKWVGQETQYVAGTAFHKKVEREIIRPGEKDAIVLNTFYVSPGRPRYLSKFDIIVYDAASGGYEMFAPGYREFSHVTESNRLISVTHPQDSTIVWEYASVDGGKMRTTVKIENGRWEEKVELMRGNGQIIAMAESILYRDPSLTAPTGGLKEN